MSGGAEVREVGDRDRAFHAGAGALWASAFVIMAMIIVQAGRLDGPGSAHAGNVVSDVRDLTIMTAQTAENEDVLAILDRRAETLSIYNVQQRQSLELMESYALSTLFGNARRGAGPRP